MGARQAQIRQGWEGSTFQTTTDLNVSPYTLTAGRWSDNGEALEIGVMVQATTLAELYRYVAPLQRLLTAAAANETHGYGEPVWIYTKTCDAFETTAEIGPTWRRKRITAGVLVMGDPSEAASGRYTMELTLSLGVEALWQRCRPQAVCSCESFSLSSPAHLLVNDAYILEAPRISWSATTGLTIRYFWYHGLSVSHPACETMFFEVNAGTIMAWWDNTAKKFKMQDNAGTPNTCASAAYTFSTGELVEVIFRFSPGNSMTIYVNGVKDGTVAACTFDEADTYTLLEPDGDYAVIAGVQVWPTGAFTDAECTGLAAWGRPELECPVLKPPADATLTNAAWLLRGLPGEAWTPLRLVLTSSSQDFRQVRVGCRLGKAYGGLGAECEDATLGTATLSAADATASGGDVAQFTPTDTSWATRVTATIISSTGSLHYYAGDWRVLLAGKDNASAMGVNQVQWRLVVNGVAGDWSETYSFGAVSTYALLDMGTLTLPPGAWPEGADQQTTNVHGGDDVQIEIQAANTTGSGGGTLNMDKLFLQPVEQEGVAMTSTFDATDEYICLDFAATPPSGITVYDRASLEFAGWADYTGDQLGVLPGYGSYLGALLWLACYRDDAEQYYPLDEMALRVLLAPRYRMG